jgi:hypothetical protein
LQQDPKAAQVIAGRLLALPQGRKMFLNEFGPHLFVELFSSGSTQIRFHRGIRIGEAGWLIFRCEHRSCDCEPEKGSGQNSHAFARLHCFPLRQMLNFVVIIFVVIVFVIAILTSSAFQILRRTHRTIVASVSNLNCTVHIGEFHQRSTAAELAVQTVADIPMTRYRQAEFI